MRDPAKPIGLDYGGLIRTLSTFDETVATLRSGKPALFPTDTVYGVGVSVLHAVNPDALFALKRRSAEKPVAWLVASCDDLDRYGENVPELARRAASAFWPGPLTLIVKASHAVPPEFSSTQGTVGLRMPNQPETIALIRAVGAPLATSSANFSGEKTPRMFSQVDPAFAAQVEATFVHDGAFVRQSGSPDASDATAEGAPDAVPVASGIASTVLDCTCDPPRIIREGAVSLADIARVE